jgi:hypothetical protein
LPGDKKNFEPISRIPTAVFVHLQVASFELLDSLRDEAVTVPASQLGSGQVAASIGGMQAMASLA